MASVNKAILIGNLGKDPELRSTSNGTSVCELRIATNERWKNKQGEFQERTEWHRVVVWGRQADSVSKYLTKGRSVYVEGRIQTRKWEDRDGNPRYTTEIVATNVVFLQGRGGGDGQGPPPDDSSFGGGGGGFGGGAGSGSGGGTSGDFDDADIPF